MAICRGVMHLLFLRGHRWVGRWVGGMGVDSSRLMFSFFFFFFRLFEILPVIKKVNAFCPFIYHVS